MTDRDAMIEAVARAVMVCNRCEGEGCYADGLDEAACSTECTLCGGNGWIVDLTALEPFMQAREQAAREEGRTEGFGWWPIETAPRDGTRIIAADFSPLEFGILGEAGCVCWNASGEYWEDHGFQYCTIQPEPTHWTPLPSPSERNKHRKQQDG